MRASGVKQNNHATLKAFDDSKSRQKNVWSNLFWYVKVYIYIYSENLLHVLYIEIKQMLKCQNMAHF